MDRQSLLKTLATLLEDVTGETYDNVQESFSLRAQLGVDSVDLISLVGMLENNFKIRIASDELQTLETVAQLLDLLEKKIGGQKKPNAA